MVGGTGGDLLDSFLGALQASCAVLLTSSYGVIAAQFKLLDPPSATKISSISVRMFLPALLIVKVGSELHADTGMRYVPVLSTFSVGGARAKLIDIKKADRILIISMVLDLYSRLDGLGDRYDKSIQASILGYSSSLLQQYYIFTFASHSSLGSNWDPRKTRSI